VANDAGTLVCGPMTAEVADDNAFEEARRKIDAINEPVEWYFTIRCRDARRHGARRQRHPGRQGRDNCDALIGFYPPEREGAPPPPTHYEVLLPSGRTGWVPVTAVRPLKTITFAMPASQTVNGRSPPSTKQRGRLDVLIDRSDEGRGSRSADHA
jgi:hypothetical protein